MKHIAIVGGGISGISAAFYARQQGWSVDLYEASDDLGGRVGCTDFGGRNVEFGGKNIGLRYARFRDFTQQLGGIEFEEFGLNSSRAINGRVTRFNKDGSKLRTLSQIWRMCGPRGVAQLLPHVLAIRANPDDGFLHGPYFDDKARSADERPLSAHFSKMCTTNFIRTLTVRMNGAEPDECYLGNFGSNLGLVLDKYEQAVGGMRSVLDAFGSYFRDQGLYLGQYVRRISEPGGGRSRVESAGRHGEMSRDYDHVIVALPAPTAAKLLDDHAGEVADLLRQVRYFPVAVAIARYRDNVFSAQQRAMVFDADSPLSNAGAYGIHDLNLVRYTFSGRAARTMIDDATDPEQAIALAETRIGPHFNIWRNKREDFTYRYMQTGLCAYSAHHADLLQGLSARTPPTGGLSLTGDYWRGASIEACFRASQEVVTRLAA